MPPWPTVFLSCFSFLWNHCVSTDVSSYIHYKDKVLNRTDYLPLSKLMQTIDDIQSMIDKTTTLGKELLEWSDLHGSFVDVFRSRTHRFYRRSYSTVKPSEDARLNKIDFQIRLDHPSVNISFVSGLTKDDGKALLEFSFDTAIVSTLHETSIQSIVNASLIMMAHPNGIKSQLIIDNDIMWNAQQAMIIGKTPFIKVFIKQTPYGAARIMDQYLIRIQDLMADRELEWERFLFRDCVKYSQREQNVTVLRPHENALGMEIVVSTSPRQRPTVLSIDKKLLHPGN